MCNKAFRICSLLHIVIGKECVNRYSILTWYYIVLNFAILQTNDVSLTNNTKLNEPECNALSASIDCSV